MQTAVPNRRWNEKANNKLALTFVHDLKVNFELTFLVLSILCSSNMFVYFVQSVVFCATTCSVK